MIFAAILLFAQVATSTIPSATRTPGISAQMGIKVSPDTVAVGDPFTLLVRVRVKRGFVAEFPQMPDSSDGRPSLIGITGKPVIERAPDDSLEFRARYTLTAWDIGMQPIPLTDVHVTNGKETGFLPVRANVFVKSILPEDSSLRVAKPPRGRFPVHTTNWWPLIILAAALALAELLWWVWKWYRARKNAPRDPFEVAMAEFGRIDAMQLPAKGEPERHAVLASEAMRTYLAHKVESVSSSNTSIQLTRNVLEDGLGDDRVREVLEESDLLKFANARIPADAAVQLGVDARAVVELVEKQVAERSRAERKAA